VPLEAIRADAFIEKLVPIVHCTGIGSEEATFLVQSLDGERASITVGRHEWKLNEGWAGAGEGSAQEQVLRNADTTVIKRLSLGVQQAG
jgi:hypothetical protein